MKKVLLVLIVSIMALLLSFSSQAQVKTIDLSKLELLNKIVIPGHAPDTLINSGPGENPFLQDHARFSPNSKSFVVLDNSGRLIWWEVSTGKQLESWRLWRANEKQKFMLTGFPTRNTICLSEETTNGNIIPVKQFNLETGKMLNNCKDTEQKEILYKLDSPDKKYYLEIEDYTYPVLFEAKTKKLIQRFGHSVTDFDITSSGDVITGSKAGTIRVWNVRSGNEASRLIGRNRAIKKLLISPKGDVIVTLGESSFKMYLWNLQGVEIGYIQLPPTAELNIKNDYYTMKFQFSADSQVLGVEFDHKALRLYSTKNGAKIPLPPINQNSSLHFANSSTAVLQLEKVGQRHRLSMVRIRDGNALWTGNWRDGSSEMVFSPDGKIFARQLEVFYKSPEKPIDIGVSSIDSLTGEGMGWFKIKNAGKWEAWSSDFTAIAPGNRVLLLERQWGGDGDTTCFPDDVRMFDLQNKSELKLPRIFQNKYIRQPIAGCPGNHATFKFSPDGRYFLARSGNIIDVWGTRDNSAIFKGQ